MRNLELCGAALRAEDGQAQILWQHSRQSQDKLEQTEKTEDGIQKAFSQAGNSYLRSERGEPSHYIYLHAAALVGLVSKPPPEPTLSPGDYLSQVGSDLHQAFSYRNGFLRYEGSDKSLDVGLYWVRDPETEILPLSDRVEMALVKTLLNNPGSTYDVIDSTICREFPGLCPPENALIQVCLDSMEVNMREIYAIGRSGMGIHLLDDGRISSRL